MGAESGRTFLVTGGNTGIGLPTATELARLGGRVYIASRSEAKGSDAVARGGAFLPQISGVTRKSRGKCGGAMTVYQAINYEGATIRRQPRAGLAGASGGSAS